MDELSPPAGIPAEDWATTPLSVRVIVLALLQQVATLTAQVQELQARLNQTSQNSSKPPSSAPPSAPPRPATIPRGRPRGAQPAHPGHSRPLLPPDQVDEIHECRPTRCSACQNLLASDLPDARPPLRTQVWELPQLCPTVTEYRLHLLCCPCCHHLERAPLPQDAPPAGYGPRLTALLGLLHGTYHLSDRAIADLLTNVWGIQISLGSIVNSCQRLSTALERVDADIQAAVQVQPSVNVDETGWREQAKRCWLWVARSAHLTCFRISASRGQAAFQTLLGATFAGIATSDRWSAYNRLPDKQRQLCWAHLTRTLRGLAEWGHPDSAWAGALLKHLEELLEAWRDFREAKSTREGLAAALLPVQQALEKGLKEGVQHQWHHIHNLSKDLLKHWEALWTFVRAEGGEPTNNAAERALRPAVIWRKLSFGTQSEAGSRFVERILSVVMTCRQQGRNVWAFLTQALQASWSAQPLPSLISP